MRARVRIGSCVLDYAEGLRMLETPADDDHAAAAILARRGASKGGRERAARLSPDERSESAREAAEARWGRTVIPATHSGELIIGDRRIDCAVLEDGRRVL